MLSVVFWPATALLNLTPFRARDHGDALRCGPPGSVESARSWVLLYAALCDRRIIPRLVLAFRPG